MTKVKSSNYVYYFVYMIMFSKNNVELNVLVFLIDYFKK